MCRSLSASLPPGIAAVPRHFCVTACDQRGGFQAESGSPLIESSRNHSCIEANNLASFTGGASARVVWACATWLDGRGKTAVDTILRRAKRRLSFGWRLSPGRVISPPWHHETFKTPLSGIRKKPIVRIIQARRNRPGSGLKRRFPEALRKRRERSARTGFIPSVRRPAAPISANAGARATPP